jgi:DNA-binding response OmpR family regulator
MNILIIEDDIFLGNKIKEVFKKRVITNKITLLSSYESFLDIHTSIHIYDIILIDINIDSQTHHNGIDIVKYIR